MGDSTGKVGWLVGLALPIALWGASGCEFRSCTDKGCVGSPVSVALVDDDQAPVAARGEVRYAQRGWTTFDCTVLPGASAEDADCQGGVLQLGPIYNRSDTIDLRFQLADRSFTDWLPLELTGKAVTLKNFNGPDCDCTTFDGSAKAVLVPSGARLVAD